MPALSHDDTTLLLNAVRYLGASFRTVRMVAERSANTTPADAVHVHVSPSAAPAPVRVSVFQTLSDTEALIRDAAHACGLYEARSRAVPMLACVRHILAHPEGISIACDEEHGDPDTWLADFLGAKRKFDAILNPPIAHIRFGVCPVCRRWVWGEPTGDVGVCEACKTRVPRSMVKDELSERLASSGITGTAAELSRLLRQSGYKTQHQPFARGRIEDSLRPLVTARNTRSPT